MIGEFLRALGVPGKFVLLASAGLTLYHFREVLGLAATIGTVVKIGLVFTFLGVVGVTGVVPGFRVVVDLGTLESFLTEGIRAATSFL